MISCGDNQDQIATALGTDRKTLAKYYSEEISTGLEACHAEVKATAYRLAVSGRCPAMTMFWLKTRCGWRETSRLEVNIESLPDDKLLSLLETTAGSGSDSARALGPGTAQDEDI